MDSDFFLIRKMRQGDEAAFDIFVRKYYGDILRYCACRCFDAEDAQDLTQETFARFFSRFSDYRHKGKTKNYLYTIAGNLCKNYYKKNRAPAAGDVYGVSENTAESPEESVIERAALEWALDQLDPELREVIDLYYFRELKLREMAETLHIGLPLVKYRLRRAKERLQEMLGKERKSHGSGRSDGNL